MSDYVFPELPSQVWPVEREPVWDGLHIEATPSGREFRSLSSTYPRQRYDIRYSALDGNRYEAQRLVDLFNSMGGGFDHFLFRDRGDDRVTLQQISGRFGDVPKADRHQVTFTVRSQASLLDVMVPGDVYQPGCKNRLFDGRCALSEAAFTVAGVVASATVDRRAITSTSAAVIAKPSTWATLGTLRFTSGPNAGTSRPVRVHTLSGGVATVTVIYPFAFAAGVGDAFELVAGCDKTTSMCTSKFINLAHFRGEKFVPPPESIA